MAQSLAALCAVGMSPALADQLAGAENAITATAAGTQANSYQLTKAISRVTVVATAGDGVKAPPAVAGASFALINDDSKDYLTVFGFNAADTVGGVLGSTGLVHPSGKVALYVCAVDGVWSRNLSA